MGELSGVRALHYPGMSVDPATWTVTFDYALHGSRTLRFTETLRLPPPARPPDDATAATLHRVLALLYVAAGTSYYKLAAPPAVVLDAVSLSEKALPWAAALYRQGLAEFAYRNDLPHVLTLDLTADGTADPPAAYDNTGARPLVPIGGGKDSVVSVEALRGLDPVLVSVNPNELRIGVMDVAGLPQLHVTRTLDPRLFELNRAGAYNGHVPVTAINSLAAVATAILHGLGPVVMSNERSASVPNLVWSGYEVNHQWSKGIEAEGQLREALGSHAGLTDAYFSLLRPLSELHIARLFARFTAYDTVVTSCNAAFRFAGRSARWCGQCPKCRFVFLALAPFMPRARLTGIFAADLLDDEAQLPGYRELAGITRHKPFECVGEPAESLAALRMVAASPDWADHAVVRQLRTEVADPDWLPDAEFDAVFRADAPHYAPERYADALRTLLAGDRAAG
jgi:UDP-N-acetyl-alpha-D-muramoyl-L-alanyl-L-glutamate epimerase